MFLCCSKIILNYIIDIFKINKVDLLVSEFAMFISFCHFPKSAYFIEEI